MKKTFITLLLCTVLCASACDKNAKDFVTNGNGIILRYIGRNTVVVIPSKIGFETITDISDCAFWVHWRNKLTSVTIPDSVVLIEAGAFMDNKLTSVNIPKRVKIIEACAFAENKLSDIIIPNSVITIGDGAFEYNKLTNIIIPNSVTSIGRWAFAKNNLSSVTIGNGISSITEGTFYHNQITSINICENVELADNSFGYGFENAYNNGGKKAGTYTRPDIESEIWTRQ